jgi:autotransporter-associated beta strand protein
MKRRRPIKLQGTGLVCAAALFLFPTIAGAAVIAKANNAVDLNLTNSWLGEVLPANTDVAVWNSTVTGPNVVNLGANQSWLGLKLLNPLGVMTIGNSPAATLTLGTNGVDMSGATTDLTMLCNVTLGTAQTWDVAAGRTNTVAGVIGGTSPATLTKAGAGTLILRNVTSYTGRTVIGAGTLALQTNGLLNSGII